MNHLQRYLVDEFVEDYQEGQISRRKALRLLTGIIGWPAAVTLLAACGQPTTQAPAATAPVSGDVPTAALASTSPPAVTSEATAAATTAPAATTEATVAAPTAPAATAAPATGSVANSVPADDPAIVAEGIMFPASDGEAMGYLARPAADGTFPIVLVCHENRGLTPHIQDVARRLAKAGYAALAVDLLWREGGAASITDTDTIPGLLSGAPPERHVADFQAGLNYLKTQPYVEAERVGMVGFCFGGGVTWLVAANTPELKAAVPFYGPPVPESEVPKINAAVLAIYAERDNRINQSIPTIEAAMQANGKTYQKIIYPGVDHAFHNDTGQRYNAEQAQAAWSETLAWFEQYV
jgi:carboxymethylenebutenolidase